MRKFSVILLLLTSITACGQRGPLYLPKDATQPETNAAQNQAPASELDGNTGSQPQPIPKNEEPEQ